MFLAACELPPIEKSTGGNDRRDLNAAAFPPSAEARTIVSGMVDVLLKKFIVP